MAITWITIFWVAVALIAYAYVLFPALVILRGLLVRRAYVSADVTPPISMIIVAHNEESAIGAKLDNVLQLDYPRDRFEVIVASDGSTDATEEIVAGFAKQGVRLLRLARQGKIPALNTAVAAASGEMLVFSDANSMYAPNALKELMRPLADPKIGGVAGDQRYLKDDQGTNSGERAYWNFDRLMKQMQSAAGNVISATGAIYAIRRSLFSPVPTGVTDDFMVSTGVIAQRHRLVFNVDAIAYEPVAPTGGIEFGRKVRVTTRGLHGVVARRELLNPLRHGFYSVQLFSHKVLRRLVALPLIALLMVTPLLWESGTFYRVAMLAQLAFVVLAIAGLFLAGTRIGRTKVLSLPAYFCLVNGAALLATVNVLRGRRIDIWKPQRVDTTPVSAASRPTGHGT